MMASGLITTFFLGAPALGFDKAGFFDLEATDFLGFSAAFTLDDFLIVALLLVTLAFGKLDSCVLALLLVTLAFGELDSFVVAFGEFVFFAVGLAFGKLDFWMLALLLAFLEGACIDVSWLSWDALEVDFGDMVVLLTC